ncbi:DUF4300 family protein [Corynebacterium felinum]|uniref:DUF4300 domain-containing protein n=1 Tax=Corynebacterium felinum TaxID=131318 RepID=A0ABU2B9X7_9CORY|nr:DUF4300 family protein [Corynebacterium felinum]MDF5820413.1 DUF4300 family protein [Corynebacterium felinum]MDR7355449.1 hypothetical protein [Corynebacterium felinum]WJY94800.1 hypothetical protein CFELI_05885 [Corynebacterium felinum]
MRWENILLTLIGILTLTLTGCASEEKAVTFSNLVDTQSHSLVREALSDAGVSEENISRFLSNVEEFNTTVPTGSLVAQGFVNYNDTATHYDLEAISEAWLEKYPEYPGTNCRINSFVLGANSFTIASNAEVDPSLLFIDSDSLRQSPILNEEERHNFDVLYGRIPTTAEKDPDQHAADIEKYFARHNIVFNNPNVHFVAVFLHDILDEPAHMFIGHVGIAVEHEGKMLFIEKLAFDKPYQALLFPDREHLQRYLMDAYDDSAGQDYSHPLIVDNGKVLPWKVKTQ